MRWALAAVALLAVGVAGYAAAPRVEPLDPWAACVARCEQESPADRGQGCMDTDCNPLLDQEEEPE